MNLESGSYNQQFESRVGWLKLLLENLFWKNFNHFIAEAAKALMPYFEVLQGGLVKRPCDAGLAFCSWVLDLKTKIFEKNWRRLTQKMFIDKQLQK